MKFSQTLKTDKFIITAELFPPKGCDISVFLKRAQCLQNIDAINVTDNQRASMRAGSLAMCCILKERGFEPILQLTARDRNRIALQTELLSASILGIENVVVMSGDHPNNGEYPDAKAVYDLDTLQLIKTVRILESGFDLAGKKLKGAPKFCLGAVANPAGIPQELQLLMIKKKVLAGVEFFQTQTVFDMPSFREFYKKAKEDNVKILAGITLLKSVKFMEFLKTLPGVKIPKALQKRMYESNDPLAEGMKICIDSISELADFADGVHVLAIGAEEYIPEILKRAKVR